MILRMSQSSQASPLTSWQTCSSLITWGKVRDPSVDPSSLVVVEQWLGFGAEPILPSSLPGSQVRAGNGRGRSTWTPSVSVAVLKFSGVNLLHGSISCCPHCSCHFPNFTLLVYDRCRLILRIMKSLFHPSLCSHGEVFMPFLP